MHRPDQQVAQVFLDEAICELKTCAAKIHHCVDQLSDQQVWWRSGEEFNSIGNLVLHLTGNLSERLLSVVGGISVERNRAQEFAERRPIAKVELLAGFDQAVDRAVSVMAKLESAKLLERRRYRMLAGEVENALVQVILQTLVHLGGHTQEIVAATRLQLREGYRFQKPGNTRS